MLATERQNTLLKMFRESPTLEVSQVSKELGVSLMTVRRDLNYLADAGKIKRVHGGAMAASSLQFTSRLQVNARVKKQLITKIGHTVPTTGNIYIDGSTTMFNLCDYIKNADGLYITTNNLQTFKRLGDIPGVHAMIIGGSLDSRTENLVGPLARKSLQHLHYEIAYMSCYALGPEPCGMEATMEDAEIKEIVAERSNTIYLAINHEKLTRTAAASWALPRKRTTLVTNLSPDDNKLKIFKQNLNRII